MESICKQIWTRTTCSRAAKWNDKRETRKVHREFRWHCNVAECINKELFFNWICAFFSSVFWLSFLSSAQRRAHWLTNGTFSHRIVCVRIYEKKRIFWYGSEADRSFIYMLLLKWLDIQYWRRLNWELWRAFGILLYKLLLALLFSHNFSSPSGQS